MATQVSEVYVGKKVPSEHVSRLKLRGVHNGCGPCCDAIREAIWTRCTAPEFTRRSKLARLAVDR
jgi:hypothetical protein